MALTNIDNQSLSPLPHPVRVEATMSGFENLIEEILDSDWSDVRHAIQDESYVLMASLLQHASPETHPYFRKFVESFSLDKLGTSTEQGALMSLMVYLRHVKLKRPHFVVDDALVESLLLTDIADDVPVSYLIPPYPGLYLELGRQRTNPLVVPNMATGAHVLEGAYIEQGLTEEGEPLLQLLLVGSPVGKSGPLDDATVSLSLSLVDPEKGLATALRESFLDGQKTSESHGLRHIPESFEDPSRDALLMIVKVLLYINLPEARKAVHADRTAALKDIEQLKSPGKKAKALRRVGKTYDYVLISTTPDVASGETVRDATEGGGKAVKAHFRRGHLRMQAHGPQRSLRKLIHIKPMRIGKMEPGVAAPTYVVK